MLLFSYMKGFIFGKSQRFTLAEHSIEESWIIIINCAWTLDGLQQSCTVYNNISERLNYYELYP